MQKSWHITFGIMFVLIGCTAQASESDNEETSQNDLQVEQQTAPESWAFIKNTSYEEIERLSKIIKIANRHPWPLPYTAMWVPLRRALYEREIVVTQNPEIIEKLNILIEREMMREVEARATTCARLADREYEKKQMKKYCKRFDEGVARLMQQALLENEQYVGAVKLAYVERIQEAFCLALQTGILAIEPVVIFGDTLRASTELKPFDRKAWPYYQRSFALDPEPMRYKMLSKLLAKLEEFVAQDWIVKQFPTLRYLAAYEAAKQLY